MKNLFEYKDYQNMIKITDEEVLEMANISSDTTGIENIIIWLGPNPSYHGKIIKVSNSINKFNRDDCFVITIPDYKIIDNVNTKLISTKVLEDIIKFIEININLICDFSDEKILTDQLVKNLISIKNYENL